MIRDPFYRKVEERLAGKLDPDLFERCASDVLRKIHPTLVPIRGGSDFGMDGAISDAQGLAFPLVVTTQTNVLENLRKNLKSYLDSGGERRKCVVGTSQTLTPARRSNLEKGAQQLGFEILQIHERAAFADLLYRDSKWCRELLNLVGSPPALSVMPLPHRPLVGDVLVGRTDDLDWLLVGQGDQLLIGQPGAGKTFLLQQFAKAHEGLFCLTTDLTQIAEGLRDENPQTLIVDDAHVEPDFLVRLRGLRTQIGSSVRIIADAWPGSEAAVKEALDVPSRSVRRLDLLSKDDIAEIVKATGIGGPRNLIQEIVNQAEGKPGLAITLAHLCLRGDWKSVGKGDVLAREIERAYKNSVGEVRALLAAFSVGGDAGMRMQDVADFLRIELYQVHNLTATLAIGGVLVEVNRDRLAVRPPALRHAYVRDVFFGGATSLPIDRLIAIAPNPSELASTIVGAQHRGALVPTALIQSLMESCRDADVWAGYAALGRSEAEWIAQEHHDWVLRIGHAMLQAAPELAIPLMIRAAVGDDRSLNANADHPIRILQDWITSAVPGTQLVMERRRLLLNAAETWLRDGGDPSVGMQALALSLSPAFHRVEAEPGSGMKIVFSEGFVAHEDAKAIRVQWKRVFEEVSKVTPDKWGAIREVVEAWAYHRRTAQRVQEGIQHEAEQFGAEMIQDLCRAGKDSPGITLWAREIAGRLKVELPNVPEPAFEILFPLRPRRLALKEEVEENARATELAGQWMHESAKDAVARILYYEKEAEVIGHTWPRWTPFICELLSRGVTAPVEWLEGLIAGNAAADLAMPFLDRILRDGSQDVDPIARRCLEREKLRLSAAVTLLCHPGTPSSLNDLALTRLKGGKSMVEFGCLRGTFPEGVVLRILSHADDEIALAAAIGEWSAEPKGSVRPSLRDTWESAIVRCDGEEWHLQEILREEPKVAARWLARCLTANENLWRYDDAIEAALQSIGGEDRREVMAALPENIFPPAVVRDLVNGDVALFKVLLGTPRLKRVHLAPLIGHPNTIGWATLAESALAAGYSTDEVADSAFGDSWEFEGSESAMWSEWAEHFHALSAHPKGQIAEIGRRGWATSIRRRDDAIERERKERVRG